MLDVGTVPPPDAPGARNRGGAEGREALPSRPSLGSRSFGAWKATAGLLPIGRAAGPPGFRWLQRRLAGRVGAAGGGARPNLSRCGSDAGGGSGAALRHAWLGHAVASIDQFAVPDAARLCLSTGPSARDSPKGIPAHPGGGGRWPSRGDWVFAMSARRPGCRNASSSRSRFASIRSGVAKPAASDPGRRAAAAEWSRAVRSRTRSSEGGAPTLALCRRKAPRLAPAGVRRAAL